VHLKEIKSDMSSWAGLLWVCWGTGRIPLEVDFLVNREDIQRIDDNQPGYECKYRSENVSQYVSPLKVFGEVDFLYAFRCFKGQKKKRYLVR